MDRFAKLVIALAAACSAAGAYAGYAQLAAPTGFGSVGGGYGYAVAANDVVAGRVITQAGALTANVGGQSVKMAAAYRLAANAPIYAARAIFLNPYVGAAVGIAAWLAAQKVSWDPDSKRWVAPDPNQEISKGMRYFPYPGATVEYNTATQACQANIPGRFLANGWTTAVFSHVEESSTALRCWASLTDRNGVQYQDYVNMDSASGNAACPAGWVVTSGGCSPTATKMPLTQDDLVRLLNPDNQVGWPMPDTVPKELPPGTILPVEQPVINPSPGVNPAPQPLFVPSGNPVPNPKYDPNAAPGPANQPYNQPGVRIVPTPLPGQPWNVDLQPVDRPVATPVPSPNPTTEPSADPDPNDKPREETPDLCQLHPEILACQKLDEPADTDLPSSEKPVSITPDSGWGADNATCPAPRHLTVQGRDIPIPFDLWCTYMKGMRPIIIAMAWLSAAFILLGARESNG